MTFTPIDANSIRGAFEIAAPNYERNGERSVPVRVGTYWCVFICVMGIVFQWKAWSETPLFAVGNVLASLAMTFVAIVIWPQRLMRPLSIGCASAGFLWLFSWVATWNRSVFPVAGLLAGIWLYVFLGVGFLTATRPRGRARASDILVGAFLVAAAVQPIGLAVSRPEWFGYSDASWWPTVHADRAQFHLVITGLSTLWAVIATAFCIVALHRVGQMKTLDRVVALPLAIGFCIFGLISGLTSGVQPYTPPRENGLYFLLATIMMSIPLGLIGSITNRFTRRIILTEQLNHRLSRSVLTGDLVRDEFRNLLNDSSLQLYYWSDDDDSYVDVDGHPIAMQTILSASSRASISNADGHPMAAVVGEATLVDHVAILESFLKSSSLAIENIQLQANIKAQLERVRASRARIVEATLEERRRIERDLHDGVQQRLLAVQAKLGTLRRSTDPTMASVLEELSGELRSAIESLRDLARGIHPAELRQFGVKGAIEVMVERMTVPVHLDITTRRFSAVVESTIYFVVSEGLANVIKHANATQAWVSVHASDEYVEVDVRDNGTGSVAIRSGGGLEGLRDRLRTIGGELEVANDGRHGTALNSKCPVSPAKR